MFLEVHKCNHDDLQKNCTLRSTLGMWLDVCMEWLDPRQKGREPKAAAWAINCCQLCTLREHGQFETLICQLQNCDEPK